MRFSVNRVVQSTVPKKIEILVLKEEAGDAGAALGKDDARQRRERIVRRAAKELKEGVSTLPFSSAYTQHPH